MSGMTAASRIVVKIGSSSLTREDGGLDLNRIDAVARLVSRWRGRDREVVIVSSGAVAAGLDPLGFSAKPKDLPSVQAAAAMGQGLLMARWTAAFQAHHLDAAQVLLTTDDVMRRDHYTNVRAALSRLLGLGVVPILNENDAVTTRELRFGDNDRLAALIAQMIKADALVLLTDVDGLYTAPPDHPGSELIERVASADDLMSVLVTGAGSRVGTGGMATKVQAAMLATASGIGVQLASANDLGSVAPSRGEIIVDEGAAKAITVGKKSLLVAGVHSVLGHFEAGDVVDVASPTGLIARGVSGYDSDTLGQIAGAGMEQLVAAGYEHPRPAIHRDDLAVLGDAFSALSAD